MNDINTGVKSDGSYEIRDDFQTKLRGTNDQEYQIYLGCADGGNGIDITTGLPLKTYDEWLNS